MFNYPVNYGELTRDGDTYTCTYFARVVYWDGKRMEFIVKGDQDAVHHYGMAIRAEVREEER